MILDIVDNSEMQKCGYVIHTPTNGRGDYIFTINMQQKAEKSLVLVSCGATALQQMLKTIGPIPSQFFMAHGPVRGSILSTA